MKFQKKTQSISVTYTDETDKRIDIFSEILNKSSH